MLFYLILLFLVICSSAGVSYTKSPICITTCKILTFLLLFVPVAIRYNVGKDYPAYIEMYHAITYGGITGIEWGYWWLNYIIYLCGGNAQWGLAIMAFFTLYFFFKGVDRKYWFIYSILFILVLYMWYCSTVRQMLSAALAFYAWRQLENKKYFTVLFSLVIAFLFHYSAILYPAIYLFCKKITLQKKTCIILCLGCLVFTTFFGKTLLNIFISIVSETIYGVKYIDGTMFDPPETASGLGIIIRFIMFFIILIFFPIYKTPNGKFIITLFTLFALLDIASIQITIITRIARGIIFIYFPIVYYLTTTSYKYKQLASICVWSILIAIFIQSLNTGFNECIPYTTIFNK